MFTIYIDRPEKVIKVVTEERCGDMNISGFLLEKETIKEVKEYINSKTEFKEFKVEFID